MLLVDDILLSPFRGLFWIFKEIHKAAQEDQAGEAERIRTELCHLYMLLETARISEAEFESEEKKWLDQLELLESRVRQAENKPTGAGKHNR